MPAGTVTRLRRGAAVAAATVLLLSGCGGGGGDEGEQAPAASSGSPEASAGAGTPSPDVRAESSSAPGESPAGAPSDDAGPGSASGGGGDSARAAAFCEAYYGLGRNVSAAEVKDWAAEIRALELPPGMPEKARKGLDRLLTVVEQSDENVKQMQQDLMAQLSGKGRQEVAAFGGWLAKACADQVQQELKQMGSPSPSPSGGS